jgi:hypothetical protein
MLDGKTATAVQSPLGVHEAEITRKLISLKVTTGGVVAWLSFLPLIVIWLFV